jgi:hypothetical protein
MSVLSAFILCVGKKPCDRLIPRPRNPADYVWDQENKKAAKVEQRAVEPQINRFANSFVLGREMGD